MKQGKKKKNPNRRPKSLDPTSRTGPEEKKTDTDTATEAIHALEGAFASASLAGKAAEVLAMSESSDDPSSSSTSGEASTSVSGSSEGFLEASCLENLMGEERRRNKQKRVVAAAGTVSTVLGKQYMASPRKTTKLKGVGFNNGEEGRDKDEQFLCSMLGDESELSLAIVRDVLCQCGYDVEKALDALLELSGSSNEQSVDYTDYSVNRKYDNRCHTGHYETRADGFFECSECDSIWSVGCTCRRNYAEVLASSEPRFPTGQVSTDSNLSQKVLESFFQVTRSSEHEPSSMNWRNVVKKMQLLGPHFDVCPSDQSEEKQNTANLRKEDEYHVLRKPANEEWESVRSYYQKAATAYSKGSKEYAAYLSDQGRVKTKSAREADERASKDIFKARNKDIQNVITVDLHGQHVDQAMRVFKMHLVLVSYVQTVQTLRVITGCGTHGMGRSKLKQSVVKLLEKEKIEWKEENQGTVLVKLCGQREFNFLDCESD